MRIPPLHAVLAALALVAISCSENDITGPGKAANDALTLRTDVVVAALPAVRISEIHYDNAGTDADERIEVSMPIDADTAGYRIQLYNGSGGAAYGDVRALTSGTVTACANGTRKVVVLAYAVNGLQNGNPDGIALVGPGGTLVEFLSYGGTFTSVGGLTPGIESTDIGVTKRRRLLLGTPSSAPDRDSGARRLQTTSEPATTMKRLRRQLIPSRFPLTAALSSKEERCSLLRLLLTPRNSRSPGQLLHGRR